MELRGNVVGFGDPLRPPIKKKGRFDNATDNPSTRLFYREEWVDNRKSIYRVTEREPLGFVPSSSFYLPPAPPHPAFKPEYYKRREQGTQLVFPLPRFCMRTMAGQLFPRRIIFYAKSPKGRPRSSFSFFSTSTRVSVQLSLVTVMFYVVMHIAKHCHREIR